MSQSANVLSVAALEELRAALVAFGAAAKEVLYSVESEIRRTGDWLEEQLQAWQNEVRRCEDAVFEARQELARRRMMRIGDRSPDCTEQEEALQLARDRLENAEERVQRTKTWIRDLPHAVIDYEGRARQLMAILEGDVPRACALLDRKADTLDAYLSLKVSPGKPENARVGDAPPAAPAPERKQP